MKRDLQALERGDFDVVVVGAGISGACVAYDAACRGLTVALIDRGDFGAATSSASSKLLHGGMRFLQQLRFDKVRESAFERAYFQNLAPHLTRWVPFIVPTYRGLARSKALLGAGMLAYEALATGQRKALRDPAKYPPASRWLDAAELRRLVPGIGGEGLTGAALFYESHMHNSERMTLAFVSGAAIRGATVANYVTARQLTRAGDRVTGVRAVDVATDREMIVHARLVVNAAGPWINQVNGGVTSPGSGELLTGLARGAHLVTRPLTGGVAVALPTGRRAQALIDRGGRHVFIIPWRGHSLVGTSYAPHRDGPDAVVATEADIESLLGDLRSALGEESVSRADVRWAYAGLYPLTSTHADPDTYQGAIDFQVVDHAATDGVKGLLSAFGAKYTTARLLAERTIDQALRKLQRAHVPTATRSGRLPAGDFDDLERFRAAAQARYHKLLSTEAIDHLVSNHGADMGAVAALVAAQPELGRPLADSQPTLAAEVLHAVDQELALHLSDFAYRRSGLATLGDPGAGALEMAARLMGERHGWDAARRHREIDVVMARQLS